MRLVYQIFYADRGSAIKNCDKRLFWPPEGRKVEPPTPKNLQMTMISKKFVLFEVSISNRPVFCADRESAIENCDKRIFWPPEGRKVEPPTPKNLQTAITRSNFA